MPVSKSSTGLTKVSYKDTHFSYVPEIPKNVNTEQKLADWAYRISNEAQAHSNAFQLAVTKAADAKRKELEKAKQEPKSPFHKPNRKPIQERWKNEPINATEA